jgi:hypothetical protein
METKWNMDTKEGFDMFGNNYFVNVPRVFANKQIRDIIDQLKKLLSGFSNPIDNIDKGIENFLTQLLKMMVGQIDCNPDGTNSLSDKSKTAGSGFTWANHTLNMLNSVGSSSPKNILNSSTTKQKANYAKKIVEGLSINDTPQLITTIKSFMKTHPNIKDMTALTNLYISRLNTYEKEVGATLSSEQLFEFNKEFDNELNTTEFVKQIHKTAAARPAPSYPNTRAGYQSFMTKKARFIFTKTAEITFYPLNVAYFPYPINMTGFEELMSNTTDPQFISKLNSFLLSVNTPALPPTPPPKQIVIDPNYAYTSDLTATKTAPMNSYIDYIVQYFAFLVYYIQGEQGKLTYSTIQAHICQTYIGYINAVEFQKYRVYSTFMTPYELALFNHLFIICLQQNYTEMDIYNMAVSSTNVMTLFESASPYIDLVPQIVYGMVPMFVTQINMRVSYLTASPIQSLPLDGVIEYPENKRGHARGPLLIEYILGSSDEDYIVPNITPDPAIIQYYIPPGLEACEKANQVIQKECQTYARVIKNELYRLLLVPIMVYIIYNFYYMFFFKDCYDAKTSSTDPPTYLHSCEESGYYTPIFPDWETWFHSIEKGNMNYFFEFIFKPIKMVYTLLNGFKTFFQKEFLPGYVIKDEIPYVFFFLTVSHVYTLIQVYGGKMLQILNGLFHFRLPDGKWQMISKAIITIFFGITFLKDAFGIQLGSSMSSGEEEGVAREEEEGVAGGDMKSTAKKAFDYFKKKPGSMKEFWVKWVMTPGSGAFMIVIKAICMILYWLFKYIISIGLTGLSIFIGVIYTFWVSLFGLNTYATPTDGPASKIEFMHRVMYTKLCDTEKDGVFVYSVKSVFFFGIYFLTEFIMIHNLIKSMKTFRDMKPPPAPKDPYLTPNENKNLSSSNLAVKSFMIIIYMIIIAIVGLWCFYKFQFKMPGLIQLYKKTADGDPLVENNKIFTYDKDAKSLIERESENKVLKTILGSDAINQKFAEEFNGKTKDPNQTSFFETAINKFNEYKGKFNEGVNSAMNSISSKKDEGTDVANAPVALSASVNENVKNISDTIGSFFHKKE